MLTPGTPPATRAHAEIERLRAIAETQAAFIEEVAHFAPGSLGVRARDLLVALGAWSETVEREAKQDPVVPRLREYARRREAAGYEDAAREINEIADMLERR